MLVEYSPMLTETELAVSHSAQSKLAELMRDMDEEEVSAVRVYVSGGGCGGMTYGMTFTDQPTRFDKVLRRDGFNLVVDTVALNYLQGAEIDFVDDPMGARFVFRNVFAKTGGSGTCGTCGAAGGGCA